METYSKIINGNCIDELKKLPENSVDLIFADPPYWMRTSGVLHRVEGSEFNGCSDEWDNQFECLDDYISFTRNWLEGCRRVLKPNGSIWVIGSMQCIYTIGNMMQELGFWIINDVIWHKKNPTPNFKGTRLNNSHETLIWAAKSSKSKYTFNYKTAKELNKDNVTEEEFQKGIRKQLGSVWRIAVCQGNERLKDKDGNKLHSTQKPQELLYRIINISSKLGDTVLDPFGGTMTTGAVAKQCGRNFTGIEASPVYCQFGEKRIANTIECIGDIEKAVFDIKPPKVSLQDMIANNYFHENEKMFLKNSDKYVTLLGSGRVVLPDGEQTDIHTAAALLSRRKAARLNGFDYWYVQRDNKNVLIDEIRNNYRKDFFAVLK